METIVGARSAAGPSALEMALSPGVTQGAVYGRLPEETSDETSSHSRWDAPTVGEWLAQLGLAMYSHNFVTHQITGDLLETVEKDDLRELGVNLVGHRLLLMREIASLRRKAEGLERGKMLWQADEVVQRGGPIGFFKHYLLCRPCLRGPDHYKLTGRALVLLRPRELRPPPRFLATCTAPSSCRRSVPSVILAQVVVSHDDRECLSCSAPSSITRSIELGNIAGVTASSSRVCCDCLFGCSADEVLIDLNKELGLADVTPLAVRRGSGWHVVQLIQGAIDDLHDFGPGASTASPTPQSMSRVQASAAKLKC